MKMGKYGGILETVLALLGIVLFSALFSTIMTAMNVLRYTSSLAAYTALDTILGIAPTILWLGGLLGAGILFKQGYSIAAASDQQGFMRMVIGVLTLVLFVTLFSTVVTNIETVRTGTNVANYTAFTTVVGISPTILFLSGMFASIASVAGGFRARKKSKATI